MKLNHIQVIGRIGQDAKIIDHQGRKFIAFSLAIDESYKNQEGVKVERVTWYDCVSEQERFFKVASWLTKGREVLVDGKPTVRMYEKDGKWNGVIRISLQNISLGNTPNDERPANSPAARPAVQATPAATAGAPFANSGESDDLPF